MCLLPANMPVGVVLASRVLGCEQTSRFCDRCMWHVRVCLIHAEVYTMLTGTSVAQDQEPVGDLFQLCLITELAFPRLQNQGEHVGKT